MTDRASDDFRETAVLGVAWSLGSQVGGNVLRIGISVVLMRLLPPSDFGLLAMVTVLVGFAALFADLGLGPALIQQREVDESHRSSVFWLNLAVGGVLTLVFAAGSPLLAAFYGEKALVPLTLVVSLNFVVGAVASVPLALLRKSLRFKPIVICELVAIGVGGTVGIVLAVRGAGVWSLVAQTLSTTAIRSVGVLFACGWWPAAIWSREAVASLWRFGVNLLGFGTVNYWLRNVDKLLLGRFVGDHALGLYHRAYSLMLVPLELVSRALGSVMFPAMSAIQHDRERVARIHLRVVGAVSLVTFPMMVGLGVVASDFTMAVLGPQWMDMVPVLELFCVVGLLQSVGSLNGNLYLSQGRTDLQFRVALVLGVLGVVALVIGLRWGLIGVAVGYTVFNLVAFYPALRLAVGLVGLGFFAVARAFAGSLVCALAMGAVVFGLGYLLPHTWPSVNRLGLQVIVGIGVYTALVRGLGLAAYRDVAGLARDFRSGVAGTGG